MGSASGGKWQGTGEYIPLSPSRRAQHGLGVSLDTMPLFLSVAFSRKTLHLNSSQHFLSSSFRTGGPNDSAVSSLDLLSYR